MTTNTWETENEQKEQEQVQQVQQEKQSSEIDNFRLRIADTIASLPADNNPGGASTPTTVTKAYLVLVDSEKGDWGIIEDTLNDLNWQPGKGALVGTWSRSKIDNLIHISLTTALDALRDRSIQTFAHFAEERRINAGKPRQRKTRTTAIGSKGSMSNKPNKLDELVQETPALPVEERMKFNDLRAKLGRAK